jgi:hypothetical protein
MLLPSSRLSRPTYAPRHGRTRARALFAWKTSPLSRMKREGRAQARRQTWNAPTQQLILMMMEMGPQRPCCQNLQQQARRAKQVQQQRQRDLLPAVAALR